MAGIAALSVLAWWLLKRRRAALSKQDAGSGAVTELDADHAESDSTSRMMMSAHPGSAGAEVKPVVVRGSQLDDLHEMPIPGSGDPHRYELGGPMSKVEGGQLDSIPLHEMPEHKWEGLMRYEAPSSNFVYEMGS